MRYTYTDLLNDFLDNTGNTTNSSNTTLINFFKRKLAFRYQTMFALFTNPQTETTKTAITVANQQFYHKPVGIVDIEGATVTVSDIPYPLISIDSRLEWDRLNEQLVAVSAIPTFIFVRRDDFGIWPTPQDAYTLTLNSHIRDRSLTQADYTTGTLTATYHSQVITGSGTTWTTAMIGRWITVNDDGYWYRISDVTGNTTAELENDFEGTTGSSLAYRIGESPELPEEAHGLLSIGCTADYFAAKGDIAKATWWNNLFFTGDGNNSSREPDKVVGGLIGLNKTYSARTSSAIIRHRPQTKAFDDRNWIYTIEDSD